MNNITSCSIDRPLRILHVTGLNLNGGAARGVYWLHKGLINQRIDSRILIGESNLNDPTIIPLINTDIKNIRWLLNLRFEEFPKKFYQNGNQIIGFSTGISGFPITKKTWYKWADIIHLHWINGATVSLSEISRIKKPVVWTMRDMWPMTGGCHYAMSCERYKAGCGSCPLLGSSKKDLSSWILWRKRHLFSKDLQFIAISSWLKDCALESTALRNRDIKVIPNCIDTDEFFPIEKKIARNILNLPLDVPILLAGSLGDEPWKGWSLFEEMLSMIPENVCIIIFGKVAKISKQKNIIQFGLLQDNISLRLIYSAADVFVSASIQEAFGKTLVEAMACSTPVVAFNSCGPKDIIEHGIDGYLASPLNPKSLAQGVSYLINNQEMRIQMGNLARKKVLQKYGPERIAQQYINIYKGLLNTNPI